MFDLAGKRVTVMGLGRFGGGVGVTRWLASQGADVLVTDVAPESELEASVAKIRALVDTGSVTLRLGGHNVADFTTCDLVVASPAVPRPWDDRFLRSAEAAGVPVTTEIGLVVERLSAGAVGRRRVIGVTGSVGKSTTSAMIAHALRETGHGVALGGNIGGSLLEQLGGMGESAWVVLELSSFMLYWLDRLEWFNPELGMRARGWSPHVAVVTNVSPNHLDWHGTFEHYVHCKQAIVRHQLPIDTAVLGRGGGVETWRELTRARVVTPLDHPVRPHGALRVPGAHNIENAAVAVAACVACDHSLHAPRLWESLETFPGLVHRLQLVAEAPLRGRAGPAVRFYNDSKSTTPESAVRAVEAVAEMPGVGSGRVHLIAGGYDKGSDLAPIGGLAAKLGGLYTIGATGASIGAAAGGSGSCVACGTLDAAVANALERMRPGDVLLLSPGCASWDQYTNYEERGEAFIRLVRERAGA
jgi:UDP-N-acetylmuramoylalanine--D-glutamate ligase